jgi:hypothetical protein
MAYRVAHKAGCLLCNRTDRCDNHAYCESLGSVQQGHVCIELTIAAWRSNRGNGSRRDLETRIGKTTVTAMKFKETIGTAFLLRQAFMYLSLV